MLPTLPNIEVAELAVWPHDGTKVWWTVSTDYLCHFLYMSFPVHVISCIIAFIHAVWCVHSVSCCGMITCCWVFFTSVRHKRDCCVLQANSCHLQMKEHEPYLTPGLRKKRHLKLLTAQSDGDVPKYKLHIACTWCQGVLLKWLTLCFDRTELNTPLPPLAAHVLLMGHIKNVCARRTNLLANYMMRPRNAYFSLYWL